MNLYFKYEETEAQSYKFEKGTLLPSALTKDVGEPQAMQVHNSATGGT